MAEVDEDEDLWEGLIILSILTDAINTYSNNK
jgi:hypothetical protein